MNQWALITLTAYVLFTFLWAVNLRFPLKRGVKAACSLLLMTTFGVSGVGAYLQHDLWNGAVITAPDTRLLMSPFESASSLGAIPEGSLVFSEKSHGSYLFINDQKGRSGWVPAQSIASLQTSHTTYSPSYAAQ